MKRQAYDVLSRIILAGSLFLTGLVPASLAAPPQQQMLIQPIAEKKLHQLPAGPLYWRVENFTTLTQAKVAEGPASLTAEVAGKVWFFTVGPQGGATPGGSKVAEIGPLPPINAPEYLLRVNHASGPVGARTPVHTHPGSETFYVLTGELSQKGPQGATHIAAGQSLAGHAPGMPMEVSSSGASGVSALVMFVVDATRPFSSPAKFQ